MTYASVLRMHPDQLHRNMESTEINALKSFVSLSICSTSAVRKEYICTDFNLVSAINSTNQNNTHPAPVSEIVARFNL
jgi:hypothetical protein